MGTKPVMVATWSFCISQPCHRHCTHRCPLPYIVQPMYSETNPAKSKTSILICDELGAFYIASVILFQSDVPRAIRGRPFDLGLTCQE